MTLINVKEAIAQQSAFFVASARIEWCGSITLKFTGIVNPEDAVKSSLRKEVKQNGETDVFFDPRGIKARLYDPVHFGLNDTKISFKPEHTELSDAHNPYQVEVRITAETLDELLSKLDWDWITDNDAIIPVAQG